MVSFSSNLFCFDLQVEPHELTLQGPVAHDVAACYCLPRLNDRCLLCIGLGLIVDRRAEQLAGERIAPQSRSCTSRRNAVQAISPSARSLTSSYKRSLIVTG
jgi:hypothetical protein